MGAARWSSVVDGPGVRAWWRPVAARGGPCVAIYGGVRAGTERRRDFLREWGDSLGPLCGCMEGCLACG